MNLNNQRSHNYLIKDEMVLHIDYITLHSCLENARQIEDKKFISDAKILKDKSDTIKISNQRLTSKISDLELNIKAWNKEITVLDDHIELMDQRNVLLENKIEELEKEIAVSKEVINRSDSSLSIHQALLAIDKAQTNTNLHDPQHKELTNNQSNDNMISLLESVQAIEKKIILKKQKHKSTREEVQALKFELAEKQNENEENQKTLRELHKVNTEYKTLKNNPNTIQAISITETYNNLENELEQSKLRNKSFGREKRMLLNHLLEGIKIRHDKLEKQRYCKFNQLFHGFTDETKNLDTENKDYSLDKNQRIILSKTLEKLAETRLNLLETLKMIGNEREALTQYNNIIRERCNEYVSKVNIE